MEVTAEDLGKRSFCEAVMRARLPKAVFKELKKTIDYGAPLDAAIADSVALHAGVGKGARRNTLYTLVPSTHKPDSRET